MSEWALVSRTLSFQGIRDPPKFADPISGLRLLTARPVRLVRLRVMKQVDSLGRVTFNVS